MSTVVAEGFSFVGLRRMFYLVTPTETLYPTLEDVPLIMDQAIVWFFIFAVIEYGTLWKQGRTDLYRLNDSLTSIGAGTLQSTAKVLFRAIEFTSYCWVYEHFRLVHLPNSSWTWLLSFIAVDFAYYWFHRMSHEVLFFWSFHQMHHSSEYYNLSTALRQGMLQQYLSMFYYLPLALFLPPNIHLLHLSLNVLFQFWIHTQLIGNLGVLELIINTPSHHRVHHGRNPYCIDKNYGGTLIIWDRLFGTFRQEDPQEPVVYGLVHPINTFHQLWAQLFIFKYSLWDKPKSMKTWRHRLEAPFRGPGWEPGVHPKDSADGIPEIEYPVKEYDKPISTGLQAYVMVHFLLVSYAYTTLAERDATNDLPFFTILKYSSFIVLSLECFGVLLEDKAYGHLLESFRCGVAYLMLSSANGRAETSSQILMLEIVFGASIGLWFTNLINWLYDTWAKFGSKDKPKRRLTIRKKIPNHDS